MTLPKQEVPLDYLKSGREVLIRKFVSEPRLFLDHVTQLEVPLAQLGLSLVHSGLEVPLAQPRLFLVHFWLETFTQPKLFLDHVTYPQLESVMAQPKLVLEYVMHPKQEVLLHTRKLAPPRFFLDHVMHPKKEVPFTPWQEILLPIRKFVS